MNTPRYSAQTNALAASAVLEVAVEMAVGLLVPAVALERMVPDADHLGAGVMERAEETLLAAATSAELLLSEATS